MNNKTKLLVALGLMIITLTSVTFAAFFVSKNQTNDNKVLSGCFNTSFTENSASIRMDKALPLTNKQGLNTEPYSFTISNTCSINADYTVLLNVKNNSFSDEYISYNYSGSEVKTLNTASVSNTVPSGYTKSYILGTGILKRGKSETINIKLWLNELADYQNMTNKTFEAEIQIVSRVSTNQQYGDVTLAYTKDGEDTDMTVAELESINYKINSISCSEGSANIVYTDKEKRVIDFTSLPAVCTVDYAKVYDLLYCVDESNNKIDCPSTFTIGDRIAIGRTTPQYFRYIRTTDTTSLLNECGTTTSVACTDTDSRNNIGANKLRFLAENNLKRATDEVGYQAITENALQDPNNNSTNAVRFGASNSVYNQSYLITYMYNYQKIINTLIAEINMVSVNLLSKPETVNLFGCPASSYGECSSLPSWAKNTNYWLSSAYDESTVWYINAAAGYLTNNRCNSASPGARPVINIPKGLFE